MNGYLKQAVKIAGGQTALADRIGVKQQNVWSWLNRVGRCPAEYVLAIESATDGEITRHQLRPDIFGETPSEVSAA